MSSVPDPAKLKVVELRAELSKRGLDTKGIKSALVKRLKDALEEELKQELPDTSIADTSTEDLDSSQEQPSTTEENKVPDKEPPVEECEKADEQVEKPGENKETSNNIEAPVEKMETEEVKSNENVENKEETVNTETIESTQNTEDKVIDDKETTESKKTEDESIVDEKQDDTKTVIENGQSQETEIDSKPAEENVEIKDDQDLKTSDDASQQVQEQTGENNESVGNKIDEEPKGEKRKRSSPSPDRAQRKRSKSPIKEDEPPIDNDKVQLSWYDSDLHLQLDKESFLSAKPYHEGAFGFAWAGVRATHGVNTGKVCYEVKITEELKWEDFSKYYERNRREQSKSSHNHKQHNDKKTDDEKVDNNIKEDKEEEEIKQNENCEQQEQQPQEHQPQEQQDESKDDKQTTEPEKTMEVDENTTEVDTKESEIEAKDEEMVEQNEAKLEADEEQKDQEQQQQSVEETPPSNDNPETETDKEQNDSIPTHLFRVGWSILSSGLQLGEDKYSYGYESTGKFVTDKQFNNYGRKFGVGDVVMSFLDINDDFVSITYAVNGEVQPEAIKVTKSELPENFVLFPHVLSRNYAFELNLGSKDEPWYPKPELFDDYQFLDKIENKIAGPVRPESRSECEVILMCGLPASGKTHWVQEYVQANPDKKYTILGNSQLLEKMTVGGDALKNKYKGRWNVLLDKLQKCLNKLIEIAALRRRNYIIDQPNVFPSAQRRKLRPFEGFKRRAVVVVVGDEEQAKRQSQQEAQGGKDVPDSSVLEMKANMSLPLKGDWIDEVIYVGLDETEAKSQVQKYNTQGRDAGYGFQKRFSHRDDRHRWQNRRNDYRSGNYRDRNYRGGRYDRGPPAPLPPPPPPPQSSSSSRHNWHSQRSGGGWNRDRRDRRPPPMGRDWRNNRSGGRDRNRDSHGYNRNRNPPRSSGGSWQSSIGGSHSNTGGNWNNQSQGWNNPAWGSSQGSWSNSSNNPANSGWSQNNQWKYGGGGSNQNYGGYSNWSYYNQYPQNWSTQDPSTGNGSTANLNQYGQYSQQEWAQYAQQYAQGQTTSTGATSNAPPK